MLLLGKTWVFWECHWACQQRAVETMSFFFSRLLLKIIQKMMLGFFFPLCFLPFVLTAGICMLPLFYQKILSVPGGCRSQSAAGRLKQSLMSCRAGCPSLGPCTGTPGACQPKVAHVGPLLLLHPKAICWLMVVRVLNLGPEGKAQLLCFCFHGNKSPPHI